MLRDLYPQPSYCFGRRVAKLSEEGRALLRCIMLATLWLLPIAYMRAGNSGTAAATLVSGDATLVIDETASGQYAVGFRFMDATINPNADKNPTLVLDAKYKTFYLNYTDYCIEGDCLTLTSRQTLSPSTVDIEITDRFTAHGHGDFTLRREARVLAVGENPYTGGFYTSFGVQLADADSLADYEYFIPSVWYKSQFSDEANMPASCPAATDQNFFYRDDRLTLPIVMMRHKTSGLTVEILDAESPCATTLADSRGVEVSESYRYGGVGVVSRKGTGCFTPVATWPGNDLRTGGLGERRHPLAISLDSHAYTVYMKLSHTDSYQEAFYDAWQTGVSKYAPEIRAEDLPHAYDALIETLDHYYLSPTGTNESNYGVKVSRAGFPWGVYLDREATNATTYEIGFVGAQIQAGYALLRAGIERGDASMRSHGVNVLNFWASEGLSSLGFPKSRYYCQDGRWDSYAMTSLRQACTGMNALLEAWCYHKKHGTDRTTWLEACRKFGQWLIGNQNSDGSYYMEYNPFAVSGQKHPAGKQNKMLTVCAVRYLVEMFIVTQDSDYLEAALRAAEFAYQKQHENWLYAACVIDNPQLLDSESGQQALNSFLSLYDLTHEKRWLDAAEQAAFYTASFTYMHEVPVETDQTAETDWPSDRSIVGQHYITAASGSAADLGFAWSSFAFYRLYLFTGREIFLTMARISAHNTKQSMNLGQSLYPGKEEGLQQEAFTPRTASGQSRRTNSVMEALTWNYAAHLEPMIRFADAFGTVDLEEVERMDYEKRVDLNQRYSVLQSCDYGQDPSSGIAHTAAAATGLPLIEATETRLKLTSATGDSLERVWVSDASGRTLACVCGIGSPRAVICCRIASGTPCIFSVDYASGISQRFKYLLTY